MRPPGYRVSSVPALRGCGNCGAYRGAGRSGRCLMYSRTVGARMVCDSWYVFLKPERRS